MATTQPALAPRSTRAGAVRDYPTLPVFPPDTSPYNTMDDDVELAQDGEYEPASTQTIDHYRSNASHAIAREGARPTAPRTLMDAVSRGRHTTLLRVEPVWRVEPYQTGRTAVVRALPPVAVLPGKDAAAVTTLARPRSPQSDEHHRAPSKRWPSWVFVNLAMLAVVGAGFVTQRFLPADAAAACSWHTVVHNDTLGNLGYVHHTTAMAIARANHLANPNRIYVGQKLCIPLASWAAAHAAPAVPQAQTLALPIAAAPAQGALPAGDPCTGSRSVVWTVAVSRWAVPPGCFGGVYNPNPQSFLVNGHVIPGFGWCNWWPEALLRDPNAIFRPGHKTPRVGVPVYWAPQPGDKTGHYGFVESIGPSGWILISEMNMYWRGAGWAKVNYRYIRVDYPGASYLYN